MAKNVTAELEVETELRNKGLTLNVHSNGDLLGRLSVGKATVAWTLKNGKKPVVTRSWEELVERLMAD
jgi:hypothetical protein